MAFTRTEMSLLAYTGANGGHHLYFYSNTAEDAVTGAGFFNDFAEQLNAGDLIYDVDGAVHYNVVSIIEGVVVVAANYASA